MTEPVSPPAERAAPGKEILAGLAGAIGSVPDGMATALLAGANPVTGLYASATGPLFGGIFSSTGIMVIATTSAAALGTAETMAATSPDQASQVLATLVFLVGVFSLIAAALRLGRLTRFVSHSVMTGFLTGVSLVLVLGQLGDFLGFTPTGANSVAKAIDVLTHPSEWSITSALVGLFALVLAVGLDRTRLSVVAPLLAIVVPSVIVVTRPVSGVATASDTAAIPAGLPSPMLPSFSLITPTLVASALAVTVVILIQSAGVAGQFRNPHGRPPNIDRDFFAHGAANLATGLFQGIPVGGSVGQTAFNVLAGGVGRLSVIASGLWMVLFLVALSGLVGSTAMPTLAALLILAGVQSLKPREIRAVARTTRHGAAFMLITLVATLLLPISQAVALGVVLSAIHALNASMTDVRLHTLVEEPGRGTRLTDAPAVLPAREVTVLDIEGNLFYAGARSLERLLPQVQPGSQPVVVLRLRGRERIGATLIKVLETFAVQIRSADGRLFLSGVDPRVADQIADNGLIGPDDLTVVAATEFLGESTRAAVAEGTTWLRSVDSPVSQSPTAEPPTGESSTAEPPGTDS